MERDLVRNIEWDCSRLLVRFYNLLDQKRYQEMAALFTSNGVWVRLGKELVGPKGILEAMNERDDWLTTHLVSNIEINVIDATHAETIQYVVQYRAENYDSASGPAPIPPPMGVLCHRDQLVCDAGTWKFHRKTSRAVFVNRQRITHYDTRQ
jgi:hypothetical protein